MNGTPRELPELPGSDIDVMRDVYMTGTQRKAFDSILARLAESEARAEGLRSFAQAVMEDWHEGDLDGGYRQELAERFGLLRAIERFSPCGENCGCSEYFSDDDWKDGQHCYRMTTLLTGDPKSDAAIAQEAERDAASA